MGCLNELHKGLPSQMEKGVIKMDIQSWVEQIGANVPTNVGYVLIIRNGNDKKEDGAVGVGVAMNMPPEVCSHLINEIASEWSKMEFQDVTTNTVNQALDDAQIVYADEIRNVDSNNIEYPK